MSEEKKPFFRMHLFKWVLLAVAAMFAYDYFVMGCTIC